MTHCKNIRVLPFPRRYSRLSSVMSIFVGSDVLFGAEFAKFISEYKANARSTTLDTVEYGADDDGKDDAAAEEGNIDTVKSLPERGVDNNVRNACISGVTLSTAAVNV